MGLLEVNGNHVMSRENILTAGKNLFQQYMAFAPNDIYDCLESIDSMR